MPEPIYPRVHTTRDAQVKTIPSASSSSVRSYSNGISYRSPVRYGPGPVFTNSVDFDRVNELCMRAWSFAPVAVCDRSFCSWSHNFATSLSGRHVISNGYFALNFAYLFRITFVCSCAHPPKSGGSLAYLRRILKSHPSAGDNDRGNCKRKSGYQLSVRYELRKITEIFS